MYAEWASEDAFYMDKEAREKFNERKKKDPHETGSFEESPEYADARSVIDKLSIFAKIAITVSLASKHQIRTKIDALNASVAQHYRKREVERKLQEKREQERANELHELEQFCEGGSVKGGKVSTRFEPRGYKPYN